MEGGDEECIRPREGGRTETSGKQQGASLKATQERKRGGRQEVGGGGTTEKHSGSDSPRLNRPCCVRLQLSRLNVGFCHMRKSKTRFSDSELQVLTDEEQKLLKTARTAPHCVREESDLGRHFSASRCCRCGQDPRN